MDYSPLIKSINLGTAVTILDNTKDNNPRYIDSNNDIYPLPLMTTYPSRKVTGDARISYSLLYLQVERFKQLLIESLTLHQSDFINNNFECDLTQHNYYHQNFLHQLTCMLPSNLPYYYNKERYDNILMLLLKYLPTKVLNYLFLQLDSFGRTPLQAAIRYKQYHYALTFINWGCPYQDINNCCDYDITKTPFYSWYNSQSIKDLINANYQPGTILVLYTNKKICPISLDNINNPGLLEDGSIYEFTYIKKHLVNNDKSPFTNLKLTNKTIYLPQEDRFVHLD